MLNVPDFTKLCTGPLDEFAAKVDSFETTMKCRAKTEFAQREKSRSSARANASNGKDTDNDRNGGEKKKKERANSAKGEPVCRNCENDKSLLKHHNKKPHWTKDCCFANSKKTKEFFSKGKIKPDAEKFPSFAASASERDSDERSSEESSDE
jgi:hypothetical protein